VLVGGGIPFFPQDERRVDLELVETRSFSSDVVDLRYRTVRQQHVPTGRGGAVHAGRDRHPLQPRNAGNGAQRGASSR
jgi:hypothetical protein